MKSTLIILIYFLASNLTAAEPEALVFTQDRIDQVAALKDTTAQAVFTFTNKSKSVITLSDLNASNKGCRCTLAKIKKLVYQPEESGEIHMELDLKKRSGSASSTATVAYTVGDKKFTKKLSFRVSVPSVLSISPNASCMWQVAKRDTWKEKVLTLTLNQRATGKDYRVLFIDDTDVDAFNISYEMKDGRPFVLGEDRCPEVIRVLPQEGAEQAFQNINIFTSHALQHHKKVSVRLMVVGSKDAE